MYKTQVSVTKKSSLIVRASYRIYIMNISDIKFFSFHVRPFCRVVLKLVHTIKLNPNSYPIQYIILHTLHSTLGLARTF